MNELQEIRAKLDAIEQKVDATFRSAEKMRKYFLWTLIVTIATVVLPVIGLALVVPYYMSTIDISNFTGAGLGL